MKKHVEPLSTSFPAPSEFDTLCDDIFNPQGWAISEDHAHLAPAPFGVGAVRFLIEGSYLIAGVKRTAFDGLVPYPDIINMLQSDGGMERFIEKATSMSTSTSTSISTMASIVPLLACVATSVLVVVLRTSDSRRTCN